MTVSMAYVLAGVALALLSLGHAVVGQRNEAALEVVMSVMFVVVARALRRRGR